MQTRLPKYGVKKLTLGVVSVLIGNLFLGYAVEVNAFDNSNNNNVSVAGNMDRSIDLNLGSIDQPYVGDTTLTIRNLAPGNEYTIMYGNSAGGGAYTFTATSDVYTVSTNLVGGVTTVGDTYELTMRDPATNQHMPLWTSKVLMRIVAPADKVKVTDPTALTPEEKAEVADKVRDANPNLPAGTQVDVADNGDVTVKYERFPGNPPILAGNLSGSDVVEKGVYIAPPSINQPYNGDTELKIVGLTPGENYSLYYGTLAGGGGDWDFTADASGVKIFNANQIGGISTGDTFELYDSNYKLLQTVTVIGKTMAEETDVVAPADKVKVTDPTALTPEEKAE
ncbi:YSIRK-type signal peptide-containing protein, partial [Enterococcus faecalis]|uniref:YSIRK-type signal peptide-containing protein n=1 Tax=Enterococcus faecalis TaxID=1351 RepID=UPI001F5894FF